MRLASKLCAALVGVCAVAAVAGSASAATPIVQHHPRQAQVIERAVHQRHAIEVARAEGKISRAEARRLLARNARVIHRERVLAKAGGGRLTRHEQRVLNRDETSIHRHLG